MKSLVELLEHLLLDCGRKCGVPVARDIKTVRARVENEGDSFITITLPRLCQGFERSLESGWVLPGAFLHFKRTATGIPAFLQGFLKNIFDGNGALHPDPSTESIRCVRQILLFGKKIERACADFRSDQAFSRFAECDAEIPDFEDTPFTRTILKVCDVILDDIIPEVAYEDLIFCTHGPGAVQEHLYFNEKWKCRRWHKRLESVMPFHHFVLASIRNLEFTELPELIEPEAEEPVRVVSVSKTQTTPRIIAIEPSCMQYAQQGLSKWFRGRLERSRLTAGHINFIDQSVNQHMALSASGDRKYATLDMKEASDRVSYELVKRCFVTMPRFWEMVDAARSTRAKLPNGEILSLRKFASMGSAMCFPIEAFIFYASIIASRLNTNNVVPTKASVYSFSRDVYVYGDDLIVPTDEAPLICCDLESIGFAVNYHKSFWNGSFRESCGWDCFRNEKVTPIYLRRDMPTDKSDVGGILSSVACANQLYEAGYRKTAYAIQDSVELITGPLPAVSPLSPAVGWEFPSEKRPPSRWNMALQRREFLCFVATLPTRVDPLDGDAALAKCFRRIGLESKDKEHLSRSPRPFRLALKRKWVPYI